ncbi:acetoacetate--CoA ligase [Amorphus coralli]|uniref:acetoacetate--CoA ligase n=1 Tax=Amorphus coralli TaxID=340680 RepID=UPI00035C9E1D|nr:acetoacetate--CoA ligase [Amorphus coralli]
MTADQPLWTPSSERVAKAAMTEFMGFVGERTGRTLSSYEDLHAWSVEDVEGFWSAIWDYCGVIGDKGQTVLKDGDRMPGAAFFPEARINYAENMLRRNDDGDAIVFWGEDKVKRRLSWRELQALVSKLQQALADAGVGVGDRVAAMMPNMPETAALMLATASLGATFSSCSPDFGERGVLDRFGQIEPKVFVACDGYWYNGKEIAVADKLKPIVDQLPSAGEVWIATYLGRAGDVAGGLPRAEALDAVTSRYEARAVRFERVPFDQPLYIMFSSGTTGVPKCIVHATGGVLLMHLKEHRLHCDERPGDRVFYFTTCGWMMWNWLMSALGSEATLLLYDGSPFAPSGSILFDYADAEKMTLFGTSAKYIDAVAKSGLVPKESHDLSTVRLMTSTGSPLAPESFSFVYDKIKEDIHLASISGGTDIVGCFVLGIPIKPVFKGEIQGPGLGLDMQVWSEDGKPMADGKGELVCAKPFPTRPVMFWNDPDGAKYHAAYFDRFDNVWCHGDFAEWTPHGGIIIHGRSDATLNPGGVRIGTAEIYAQVEQIPDVLEALAIGQTWDNDVRVVLFVRLAEGAALDEALEKTIKAQIRSGASPRHVPARIVAVNDIPRTKSGKITELAVRDVVHGREVKNKEALANPEALDLYRDLPQLAD